jgi:hypothetical protein
VVPYREKAWADTTVLTLLSKENVEVNVKSRNFSRGLKKSIWQFSERLKLQEKKSPRSFQPGGTCRCSRAQCCQ